MPEMQIKREEKVGFYHKNRVEISLYKKHVGNKKKVNCLSQYLILELYIFTGEAPLEIIQ